MLVLVLSYEDTVCHNSWHAAEPDQTELLREADEAGAAKLRKPPRRNCQTLQVLHWIRLRKLFFSSSSKLVKRTGYVLCLSDALLHNYISSEMTLATVKNVLPIVRPSGQTLFSSHLMECGANWPVWLAPSSPLPSHCALEVLHVPLQRLLWWFLSWMT